jgi:circadian clock protein KaiB
LRNQNPTNTSHHIVRYKLRLFITGNAPNSRIAQENLKAICAQYKKHALEIETVDVMENPTAAIENGIYLTPALQIIEPGPGVTIFGNLNNQSILKNLFPEGI